MKTYLLIILFFVQCICYSQITITPLGITGGCSNTCSGIASFTITGGFNVPFSYFGISQAKQGNAYAGFITFTGNYETKEYIYQQLTSPLQAGKIYCLSFYVSRADGITHAIKNIGAYFSTSIPPLFSSYYINAIPQVQNQSGFITDTIGWTEIQGCFTAVGGEQYITVGNFNSNANTDTLYVGCINQTPSTYKYAYYYIDDVTLIDQTTVGIKEDISFLSEVVGVYPNPANDVINFKFSDGNAKRKIELYNIIGDLVLNEDASIQKMLLVIYRKQTETRLLNF